MQKTAIPSLFKPSTDRPEPAVKASIHQDQTAVLTRKRSMALSPLDVSQTASDAEDINDFWPTLYAVRCHR